MSKMTPFVFRLPPELFARARLEAEHRGITLSALVLESIRAYRPRHRRERREGERYGYARLGPDRQLVLRKPWLRALGVGPGDRVAVEQAAGGLLLRRVRRRITRGGEEADGR